MIELIKKTLFTSVGLATLTREKVEDISREFVEKGKLSEQEGRKMVDDLLKQSETSKNEMKVQVENYVKAALQKIDIASSSELEELKKEIQALKATLEKSKEE